MAKKRVYEVAKQLNISNKDLIDKLKGIGIEVSNHMASIDDATIEKVTELLADFLHSSSSVHAFPMALRSEQSIFLREEIGECLQMQ